ncbi:hypothetical protein [Candidatus Electronema sp. JM]|uniref:hypothetical protein n=1 Tax=Candidatus Electronema sp. JM TaxID=3401571 RepID=UPI003AA86F54
MTNYTELFEKPNELIAMTGLSVEVFFFKKAEGESKFTIAEKARRNKYAVCSNSPVIIHRQSRWLYDCGPLKGGLTAIV